MLLLAIFSFALIAQTAFAEENPHNIQTQSYTEKLRDWYTPEIIAEGSGQMTYYSNGNYTEGGNHYSANYFLFYYLLTAPDGTQKILKKYEINSNNPTGSENIYNPYVQPSSRTHWYTTASLPAENLQIEISQSGHYKVELKKIEIPAVVAYNNFQSNYNPEDSLESFSVQEVVYWLSYDTPQTKFQSYSCYFSGADGKINLFQTYNTPCNSPSIRGNENCWNTGSDLFCLPKETKVYFVNQIESTQRYSADATNLCKFSYQKNPWVYQGYLAEKHCWVEIDQMGKVKLADSAKTLWVSEFDAAAPAPEEIGPAAAINPFSQSSGSSENKNTGSSDRNNSNSGLPLLGLGAVGAAGAALAVAGTNRGRIVVKNFKSGFTDFGKDQIQKTKDFFAFLQEEKNGYWVKKFKAEEEARALFRIKENLSFVEKVKKFIYGYEFPSDGITVEVFGKIRDNLQRYNSTAKEPDGTDVMKVGQKAVGKIAEGGKSSSEVFVETVDESLTEQNTPGLQLAVPLTFSNRAEIAYNKLEDLEKKKNELGFDGIISGILDVFNYLGKAVADSLKIILGGTAPTGGVIANKNSASNNFGAKQTTSDLVEKWKKSFTNTAVLDANERVKKERDSNSKTERSFINLTKKLGRLPTAEELSAEAGVSIGQAEKFVMDRSGMTIPMWIDEAPPLVFIGGIGKFGAKVVRKELGKEVMENVINKFKQARVVVTRDKLKYLTELDLGKAKGFEMLGYNKENLPALRELLLSQQKLIKGIEEVKPTPYGHMIDIVTEIVGPNGNSGRLTTGWILQGGEMRFVTAIAEPFK